MIGSWAGDRIVVAGDYADNGKFLEDAEIKAYWNKVPWSKYETKQGFRLAPNIYDYASEFYTNVSEAVKEALRVDEYLGWKPNDRSFEESTEYIQQEREDNALLMLGTSGLDWSTVTFSELQWAIRNAEKKGTEFFTAFRHWLLKKKLSKETRAAVSKMKHPSVEPKWRRSKDAWGYDHWSYVVDRMLKGTITKLQYSRPWEQYQAKRTWGDHVSQSFGNLATAKAWVEAQ